MANEATIQLVGNVGGDPELRFTPSGAAVVQLSVCVTPRTKNQATQEWEDGEATWYRCTAWRQMAENIAESINRGDRVAVTGRFSVRKWTDREGKEGQSAEVQIDTCGPDLKWAVTRSTKADRNGGGQGGQQQRQQGNQGGQYGGQQQRQAPQDDPWGAPPSNQWNGGGTAASQQSFPDEPPF
jgi:single-strand DNA-binding protein